MDDVWTISAARAGKIRLTLHTGPPRPLVAILTEDELAKVNTVLPTVADSVRRGAFSRPGLGTAFRDAIGRDPFRQVSPGRRAGAFPWWADVALAVTGLGFAAEHSAWWWRAAGLTLAAVAAADLAAPIGSRLRRAR